MAGQKTFLNSKAIKAIANIQGDTNGSLFVASNGRMVALTTYKALTEVAQTSSTTPTNITDLGLQLPPGRWIIELTIPSLNGLDSEGFRFDLTTSGGSTTDFFGFWVTVGSNETILMTTYTTDLGTDHTATTSAGVCLTTFRGYLVVINTTTLIPRIALNNISFPLPIQADIGSHIKAFPASIT